MFTPKELNLEEWVEANPELIADIKASIEDPEQCDECNGTGEHECNCGCLHECGYCNGTGYLSECLEDAIRSAYYVQRSKDREALKSFNRVFVEVEG